MSQLRPEVGPGRSTSLPCPTNGTAYLMCYNAVKAATGLIHGRLHDGKGAHCAIGQMWTTTPHMALYEAFIDEVALVNDSVPTTESPRTRRLIVLRWLRWKLRQAGMPGFAAARPPVAKAS